MHLSSAAQSNRTFRHWLESSAIAQYVLNGLALFGVCFVLSDGILTPAQSVLGAVQGCLVVNSSLSTWTSKQVDRTSLCPDFVHKVVGITIAILALLFLVQPLGIGRLSVAFSPIVAVWLLLNFGFGIYNLAKYDYTVLKAVLPYYAGRWFVLKFSDGTTGWHRLVGILLCFTGCEALYADISAFSRRAVQISWFAFVYPCLLVAYIGQAAFIS
jgi:KUP system potassium uptake protein